MQKLKRVILLAFVLNFILMLCVPAAAKDVIDLNRSGSVSVSMSYGGVPVGGGSLTLYRVGDITVQNGYFFVPAADYAAFGGDFRDLTDKSLAKDLALYVKNNKLSSVEKKTIDAKGKVQFTNLDLGLYLLVQEDAAPGYIAVDSFLVSVPYFENGVYLYDVNASPKVSLTPVTPTPTPPGNNKQTGQLNWPVPVLAVSGMTLFTIGWVMCYRRKDEE